MNNETTNRSVSVIGLGQMGKKIAALYVEKGYRVTVWNRNAGKAQSIPGVQIAATAADAFAQNELVIICVLDNAAVNTILEQVSNEALTNKIILNLTTGSPHEAKDLEAWLATHNTAYLNGAIQVAPEQMGQPDTTILLAGAVEAFRTTQNDLLILGGNIKHLSSHAAASPAMDLATLSWLYGSYVGLLYGAALVQGEGMQLKDYRDIIGEIAPLFVDFFKHEINMIDADNYNITQSPLEISIAATRRIADTVAAAGLDTAFTGTMARLLQEAGQRGYANQEVTALLKVLKSPTK